MKNWRVKDLKEILAKVPDETLLVMPVVDEEDVNHILGFRMIRTAGLLVCEGEEDRIAFCMNGSADGECIADQVHFSGKDVSVMSVFGIMEDLEK